MKNPQAYIAQMMNTNPALKQVMDMVNANGGDAKALFYSMAQQRGIDPNTILNSLK